MKKNEENDNIRVIYYHYLAKKKNIYSIFSL